MATTTDFPTSLRHLTLACTCTAMMLDHRDDPSKTAPTAGDIRRAVRVFTRWRARGFRGVPNGLRQRAQSCSVVMVG